MARKIQVVHTYRARMVHLDLNGQPEVGDDGTPIMEDVDVNLSWSPKVTQRMESRSRQINKIVAAKASKKLNAGMKVERAFMLRQATKVAKRSRPV